VPSDYNFCKIPIDINVAKSANQEIGRNVNGADENLRHVQCSQTLQG